jgi:hypothetical protein
MVFLLNAKWPIWGEWLPVKRLERGATLTLMSLCSYTVATTEIAIFFRESSMLVPVSRTWLNVVLVK